jgi:hypothetical protein
VDWSHDYGNGVAWQGDDAVWDGIWASL